MVRGAAILAIVAVAAAQTGTPPPAFEVASVKLFAPQRPGLFFFAFSDGPPSQAGRLPLSVWELPHMPILTGVEVARGAGNPDRGRGHPRVGGREEHLPTQRLAGGQRGRI